MAEGIEGFEGGRPTPEWFQTVVELSPDGLLAIDETGVVLYANPAAHWWIGLDDGKLNGLSILDFVHPDDLVRAIDTLAYASDERSRWRPAIPFRIVRADGEVVVFDVLGSSFLHDPRYRFAMLLAREAGDHALAQQTLDALAGHGSFEELAGLLVRIYDRPTWLMDSSIRYQTADGDIRAVHSGLPDLLAGLDPEDRQDTPWHEALRTGRRVLHPSLDDMPPWLQDAARAAGKCAVWCVPVPDPGRADDAVVIAWNGEFVLPTLGQGLMLERQVKLVRVALERRDYLERLEYFANHDQLTGVLGRRRFLELLDHAVGDDVVFTLLYVDLDRFKAVNDTHGHDIGDEVLAVAAARLRAGVKHGDLIGRLGGDEFGVVLYDVDDGDVARQRTEELLSSMQAPIILRGRELLVGASVGILVRPPREMTAATVLKLADEAMFVAKRRGGDQWHRVDLD